jgi:hypothetical protein
MRCGVSGEDGEKAASITKARITPSRSKKVLINFHHPQQRPIVARLWAFPIQGDIFRGYSASISRYKLSQNVVYQSCPVLSNSVNLAMQIPSSDRSSSALRILALTALNE